MSDEIIWHCIKFLDRQINHRKAIRWCASNCQGHWSSREYILDFDGPLTREYCFRDEICAMGFKLTFGGDYNRRKDVST